MQASFKHLLASALVVPTGNRISKDMTGSRHTGQMHGESVWKHFRWNLVLQGRRREMLLWRVSGRVQAGQVVVVIVYVCVCVCGKVQGDDVGVSRRVEMEIGGYM
ncbi:hypothetical protein K440DRAFT_688539 [Wilcoxina mikolae CBS 423.85]|nr:hypothetical protein K440DRAFT_688539 [Wilcoxina mikolae CBS 423.85]